MDYDASSEPRNIVLLGATGSIGSSTLRILRQYPDRLRLLAVAASKNVEKLAAIVREFNVPHAALTDPEAAGRAASEGLFPASCTLHAGPQGMIDIAELPEANTVLVAVVGTAALYPTIAAIRAGHDIALASKEILVTAGEFIKREVAGHGIRLLPTDSEHNAIFQCLEGHSPDHVRQAWITASGGPFRNTPIEEMAAIRPSDALQHPNWAMGAKITVDSSTMANKRLEVIEARWLFDLEPAQIQVVVHPESIVHSLVEFRDGSMLAQLCPPSMTFAIQHCLLYPDRVPGVDAPLDLTKTLSLHFEPPDLARFPCLRLAFEALRAGGSAPAVFNASNEIAVERFLREEIRFTDIPLLIDKALERDIHYSPESLTELLDRDEDARNFCRRYTFT